MIIIIIIIICFFLIASVNEKVTGNVYLVSK